MLTDASKKDVPDGQERMILSALVAGLDGPETEVETKTENAPLKDSDLVRATKAFAQEDRAKSWRLLIETLVVLAAFGAGIVLAPLWWVQLLCGIGFGLVQIRVFIFYHDYLHGAIFRKSKVADVIMSLVGFYQLSVRSVWKETHDYHHRNNAKLFGSSIGSFPLVTKRLWRRMTPKQKLLYRASRHPLMVFGGYFTVFLIGMAISPFRRDPKNHWGGPIALALHFGLFGGVWALTNVWTALCLIIIPHIVALGLGSFLFFAQHNFPDCKLRGRADWDYTFAALNSSSMFDMPGFMHWITGNIGYHHIHHLNHRIPFYRLPEAMAAMPELQSPGRVSWRPSVIKRVFECGVWDAEQNRMLTYAEAG